MKLDYLNTHFINNTYRLVVAAASTISYRLDFSCENCLPFFGIFGCTWWKYMILAKNLCYDESQPQIVLWTAVGMSKKEDQICTVKYWFLRRCLAPKWTGSSTFGETERPPGVARSAAGPRHRLGTLRRDVEKCLKTPCVWGIRKNFKNNVFLRTTPLRTVTYCP